MTGYRIIITSHIYPPIPARHYDWSAVFHGYDEGDPIGYGPTEADAVADLLERYEEELEFAAWLETDDGRAYRQERISRAC